MNYSNGLVFHHELFSPFHSRNGNGDSKSQRIDITHRSRGLSASSELLDDYGTCRAYCYDTTVISRYWSQQVVVAATNRYVAMTTRWYNSGLTNGRLLGLRLYRTSARVAVSDWSPSLASCCEEQNAALLLIVYATLQPGNTVLYRRQWHHEINNRSANRNNKIITKCRPNSNITFRLKRLHYITSVY